MAKIQAVAVLVAILFMATVLVDQTECFITQSRELKVRAQGEIIQWGKIYRKMDFFLGNDSEWNRTFYERYIFLT